MRLPRPSLKTLNANFCFLWSGALMKYRLPRLFSAVKCKSCICRTSWTTRACWSAWPSRSTRNRWRKRRARKTCRKLTFDTRRAWTTRRTRHVSSHTFALPFVRSSLVFCFICNLFSCASKCAPFSKFAVKKFQSLLS